MAACCGMAFAPITDVAALAPAGMLAVVTPHNDAKLSGLAHGPPAKPPKSGR